MKKLLFLLIPLSGIFINVSAQGNLDSLKAEILSIRADVENINLNLERSKNKFQKGISWLPWVIRSQ